VTLKTVIADRSNEAWAYDALYSRIKDYGAEAGQIATLVREQAPGATHLLDVGCGTGIHLSHLRGEFQVEGVEPDAAMAAVARRRLPGVRVHEVDMRSMDLGRLFDAVVCLYSVVGYLLTADDLDRGVAAMARHLVPEGVLVVEPWFSAERWLELEEGQVGINLVEPDGELLVRMVRCWSEGPLSHMEMHYLRGSSSSIDHLVEHHRLRLYSDNEYRAAFARAGLAVERVEPGPSGRGLYVGRTASDNEVE
jgi:SAM-dependent methyltransferase